jgi:hypothetical protein
MDTFSNDLLSVVDRLSVRLGPVSTLIDGIIERIAPKVTALAVCPPASCDYYCNINCCRTINGCKHLIERYACASNLCTPGNWIECDRGCGGTCLYGSC